MSIDTSLVASVEDSIAQKISGLEERIKKIDDHVASVEKLLREKELLEYYRDGLNALLSRESAGNTPEDVKAMATSPKRTPVAKTVNTLKSILKDSPYEVMTVWELYEQLRKRGIGCSWRDPANYLCTIMSTDKSFELVSQYNWKLASTSRLSA